MRTSEVKVYKGTKHGEELNAILSGLVTFESSQGLFVERHDH